MKKAKRVFFWTAFFAGALLLALSLPGICEAANTAILGDVYVIFETYRSTWMRKLADLLWYSFAGLLSISFVWQGSQMVLADSVSFGAIAGLMIKTGMYGGFFKWIFSNPDNVTVIPDTFVNLAEQVTNFKVDIFNLLNVAGQTLDVLGGALDSLSWYAQITGALAILAVNVMLYAIVGIMLMLKIETIMVSLTGFSLLVFCGLQHMMADYAMTYAKALIGCGLKLFMCGIVGGMLQDLCGQFTTMLGPEGNGFMTAIGVILGVLVVLWIIVSNIPNYVSAIFYGVPGSSAGTAWHSAVTLASVMGKGAGLTAAGVKGTAEVAAGAGYGLYHLVEKAMKGGSESAGGDGSVNMSSGSSDSSSDSGASSRDADGS